MSIKIAHFSIDENNKAKGGASGDQTGKECCIRSWYNKPWDYYIEITDENLANKAADLFVKVANSNKAGYDQNQRGTFYNALVACKGDVSKMAKCESDCSAGISSIYKFLGLNISPSCTTRNIRSALIATGKVKVYSDKEHIASDKYAKRGGIYLKEGSHVVMAVENGSAYTTTTTSSTTSKTKVTYISHRISNNKWGNEITGYNLSNSMGYSGSFGKQIDKVAIKLSSGTVTYTAHRLNGNWGGEITGYSTTDTNKYAGSANKPIDAIAIKATGITGKLKYRVHRTDGKWGNWITGYSKTNTVNYAGSFGKPIDAIQIGIE